MHWDWNVMGDAGKMSPYIASTCTHNAILSLQIMHIIPSGQIYMAIDSPSLILCITYLPTSRQRRSYVCAADNVFDTEHLQSNG
jgi:hypothetical protein